MSCLTLHPREETFCSELMRKMLKKLKYLQDLLLYPPGSWAAQGLHKLWSFVPDWFQCLDKSTYMKRSAKLLWFEGLICQTSVSWVFLINLKVTSTALNLLSGFFERGKKKIKEEIMSPCQHFLFSARVYDFQCNDVYGMWHARSLGKCSFLLNTGRKDGGKRGGELQNTIYISGGWAHPFLCKWELKGFVKKIIYLVVSER